MFLGEGYVVGGRLEGAKGKVQTVSKSRIANQDSGEENTMAVTSSLCGVTQGGGSVDLVVVSCSEVPCLCLVLCSTFALRLFILR